MHSSIYLFSNPTAPFSMSTKNYNSFPEAPEVLLDSDGEAHLIRARQPVEQIWVNECTPEGLF